EGTAARDARQAALARTSHAPTPAFNTLHAKVDAGRLTNPLFFKAMRTRPPGTGVTGSLAMGGRGTYLRRASRPRASWGGVAIGRSQPTGRERGACVVASACARPAAERGAESADPAASFAASRARSGGDRRGGSGVGPAKLTKEIEHADAAVIVHRALL